MVESFGALLAQFLTKYALSQRSLARKSGVHYVTINRLVNGTSRHAVEFATIERLAQGIGCTDAERYGLHAAAGTLNPAMAAVIGIGLYSSSENNS